MAEYIEREALMEKMDKHYSFPWSKVSKAYMFDLIEQQPAADVVEVVRCKDCQYYKPRSQSPKWNAKDKACCRSAVITTKPYDYCSCGAKMDGKGER